ncbi:MAG: hypothetical protein QM598_01900 [Protaetiibacter sp.]
MAGTENETPWEAVIARSLAYQSMHLAGLADASMVKRAQFLMTLGVPRSDAAAMLGSNDESLRVQLAKDKKKAATPNGK